MVRKHSPTNKDMQPPKADDLKLINGIGPAVEKRLKGIGIFSFAQLAALSPADLAAAVADLTGLSTERIIKQDWIGQASKLAAGSVAFDVEAGVPIEPLKPKEQAQIDTPLVEPEQTHAMAIEEASSKALDAPKEVEVPALNELLVTSTADLEPLATVSVEETHADEFVEEPGKMAVPTMEHYHEATFTIELLIDETNSIQNMHVLHIQSKREHTWTGWQKTELIDFLSDSAEINITSDEPTPPYAEEPIHTKEPDHAFKGIIENKPLTPSEAEPRLTGHLHLRDMEIVGVTSDSHRKTLVRDTPFAVRLTLDLTEIAVPDNTFLNYKASIYGKSRGSRSGYGVGEAEGTIEAVDRITINVEGSPLASGTYRMAATVMIALPGTKLTVKPGTTAVIGVMLEVY